MFLLKYIINTRQGVSIECCYITSSTRRSMSLSNGEDNIDKVKLNHDNPFKIQVKLCECNELSVTIVMLCFHRRTYRHLK